MLLGILAPTATAVIAHLPDGETLSYQPIRGRPITPPAGLDEVFSNLDYNGGAVMPSNTNYTIYWNPAGAPEDYPSDYESGVNEYFTDLAHDSGGQGNVDSVAAQYGDAEGAFASYNSHFGGALIDTDPYPPSGCVWAPVCLTDEQIQTEIASFVTSKHLPTDLTHEYFLLTPPHVESCFEGASESCSAGTAKPAYCAYHNAIHVTNGVIVYANDPYVTGNGACDDGNHPNGKSSDGVIEGGLSHEHNESLTDPEPSSSWVDIEQGGKEIGDQCRTFEEATEFGKSFGSAPNGAKYNQVINGHLYWYQQEWSNAGHKCLQRLAPEALPTASFTATPAGYLTASFDASGSSAPGGTITYYDWQFNDTGDPYSPPQTVETTTPTVQHSFPGPGTYTVALTVFTSDGTGGGTAKPVSVSELPVAEPGWEVSLFASGFYSTYLGPMGIIADAANDLYVGDAPSGLLYKFGRDGGIADLVSQLPDTPVGYWPLGLAFGKDGELYVAINGENKVVQVDPSTGEVLRVVADIGSPLGLATDPVSGDLFVTSDTDGGVDRISDPTAANPIVTPYASGMVAPDGISAGPDGTFYVEDIGEIESVSATDSGEPGQITPLTYVSEADGVAVGANPFDPAAPSFVVANSNDGSMTRINLGTPPLTSEPVFHGGTRGDFVTVAPDGCLYATQATLVLRVSGTASACPFAPISPFQPPAAQPALPGPLTPTSADLQAVINPHGAATTFHFEYGISGSYGDNTPDADAGSADEPETVSQSVGGLSPDTSYHYRVVAHSQAGTIYGPDSVLTTPSATGPQSPPVALTLPAISGHAVPGSVLTCSPGQWRDAASFAFSWVRDGLTTIAEGTTHRVGGSEVGHRLACLVRAQGSGGTTLAESAELTIRAASTRPFLIRLTAAPSSPSSIRSRGESVRVTVPRACVVTLRLLALHKARGTPVVEVLAVKRLSFTRRGSRQTRFELSRAAQRRLKGKLILRVAATATAGATMSRPASVTIAR